MAFQPCHRRVMTWKCVGSLCPLMNVYTLKPLSQVTRIQIKDQSITETPEALLTPLSTIASTKPTSIGLLSPSLAGWLLTCFVLSKMKLRMLTEQVFFIREENEMACLNHLAQGLAIQRCFVHGSSLPKKKLGRARLQGARGTEWGHPWHTPG